MKSLGARWTIVESETGKTVVYENLETGVVFNCGVCKPETPILSILEFILSEGDPGDFVYLNGTFFTQTHKEARTCLS